MIPADKFTMYCSECPEFENSIRERATLRRAFWRKIELDFETKLALELEDAGLISHDEDDDGEFLLGPLHKQDYKEWTKGNISEQNAAEEVDWD